MRFPDDSERHAIFGMTGSGKTRFAVWALSRRSFDRMPWTIIDFKGDDLIAKIPGLRELDVTDRPPRKPGLYVVRPLPHETEKLDEFFWRVWQRGRTGIFLDEGYMLERFDKAYRAILTQGRSKRIPVITLSQSPAWISPWILRESEFITSFYLNTPADIERVMQYMPANVSTLPRFHSYMWSVKERELVYLNPVPKDADILARFEVRQPKRLFHFL